MEPVPAHPVWKRNGENSHVGHLALHQEPWKPEALYGRKPLVALGLLSEIRHAMVFPSPHVTPLHLAHS